MDYSVYPLEAAGVDFSIYQSLTRYQLLTNMIITKVYGRTAKRSLENSQTQGDRLEGGTLLYAEERKREERDI
jgi:hypothetical protein